MSSATTTTTTAAPLTKLRMAFEIRQAITFLGLSQKSFFRLEKKYGGLAQLHAEMASRLGA